MHKYGGYVKHDDIVKAVAFDEERRDHSEKSLSKDERTEIALFHSIK